MSQKEFQRVKVIENAAGGRLSVREASRLLQLSERQVQRLKRRYRPIPSAGCSMATADAPCLGPCLFPQKQLILTLACGKYQGFNDSHLAEKLRLEENLSVSRVADVSRVIRPVARTVVPHSLFSVSSCNVGTATAALLVVEFESQASQGTTRFHNRRSG
jgi:hypothetical protein